MSTEATSSGHGHVHASERSHLRASRRSRRAGRSSEPGSEAGTHPRDGQGRALSSARPHRVWRALSATPSTKVTPPSRAHCSHDLRKRARCTQLMILITSICASRAGMRGSTSALTFQLCRGIRTAPPGSVDRQRLVVGRELAKMQPHGCRQQPLKNSIPPASKCLSHVGGRFLGICDA